MSEAMKLNVTLSLEELEKLALVIAEMPTRDERGYPVGITLQDALRYCLMGHELRPMVKR